jgi:hypothetical protein
VVAAVEGCWEWWREVAVAAAKIEKSWKGMGVALEVTGWEWMQTVVVAAGKVSWK